MSTHSTTTDDRDLLGLRGRDREELERWLDAAETMAAALADPAGAGGPVLGAHANRLVANVFFENSTRTRGSFEVAAKRLGAGVVNFGAGGTSTAKGETDLDTIRNIEAMGVDAIVVRTSISGHPHALARACSCPIINGGDGRHEHPTQALLDLLVLRRALGDLAGRRVGIVGDIAHSRVARSNAHALAAFGATTVLVGPPGLVDPSFTRLAAGPGPIEVGHDLDAVLDGLDAVMMLRVQHERGASVGSDYRRLFGMTTTRFQRLRPDVPVLHPGPVNRGVELDAAVLDAPSRQKVLEQTAAGVAVRMAVLARAFGG